MCTTTFIASLLRGTDDDKVSETVQFDPFFVLLNILTALKESQFQFVFFHYIIYFIPVFSMATTMRSE